MKVLSILSVSILAVGQACSQGSQTNSKLVGGGCDGCDLMFEGMPKVITSTYQISSATEQGEPLQMSGTVYKDDGISPAQGVIVYFYHTDAKGHYSAGANQTQGVRHGHLRGWTKTDTKGKYLFSTIRPGSYPSRDNPAHIHIVIKEPTRNEYYIDEIVFDDDPLLTTDKRARFENRGGSGIVKLNRNSANGWIGKRDIILGMNIPNY